MSSSPTVSQARNAIFRGLEEGFAFLCRWCDQEGIPAPEAAPSEGICFAIAWLSVYATLYRDSAALAALSTYQHPHCHRAPIARGSAEYWQLEGLVHYVLLLLYPQYRYLLEEGPANALGDDPMVQHPQLAARVLQTPSPALFQFTCRVHELTSVLFSLLPFIFPSAARCMLLIGTHRHIVGVSFLSSGGVIIHDANLASIRTSAFAPSYLISMLRRALHLGNSTQAVYVALVHHETYPLLAPLLMRVNFLMNQYPYDPSSRPWFGCQLCGDEECEECEGREPMDEEDEYEDEYDEDDEDEDHPGAAALAASAAGGVAMATSAGRVPPIKLKDGVCQLCTKRFEFESEKFTEHLFGHCEKKTCCVCEKLCASRQSLKIHLRTHTDAKPYVCRELGCGRKFAQSSTLSTHHLRTHSDAKPFVCPEPGCGKGFWKSGSLSTHLHMHSQERRFVCEKCPARFMQLSHLKNHVRTHSDDKPFVCEICGYRFKRAGDLTVHMVTHTHVIGYACRACGTGFTRSTDSSRHERNCSHIPRAAAPAVPAIKIKSEPCDDAEAVGAAAESCNYQHCKGMFIPLAQSSPPTVGVRPPRYQDYKETLDMWLQLTQEGDGVKVSFTRRCMADMFGMLDIQEIPDTDPRVGLRGQKGVFAKQALKKDKLLGIYAGEYLEGEWDQSRAFGKAGAYFFDLRGTINHRSYAFTIDAYQKGNQTALINAYWDYDKEHRVDNRENVIYIKMHYRGIPMIAVVSITEIAQGEELLVDYGKKYWTELNKLRMLGLADNPIVIE